MKISLKLKFMSALFIIIAISMISLGTISYIRASKALQEITHEQLVQQASDVSALIEKSIDSVKSDIQIASLNDQIADFIEDETSEEKCSDAFEYITKIQNTNRNFMEVLIITDNTGRVLIDTQTKTPDIDLSDRDYMKDTLNTGSISVSDVLISRFTNNPAIFLSCPIKRDNTIIGTIVGSIKFSTISSYASDLKIGEDGYGYLIDKDGLIVGHPNEDKILRDNICESDSESLRTIAEQMKAGQVTDGFYTNYQGIYKYVIFDSADKWTVAITASYSEYMSSALEIKRNTIIQVIITILISMFFLYLFTEKGVIKPIRYIEDLMKKAGEGDLTVHADIKSKDEIGELSKAFNIMIEDQEGIVKSVIAASKQLEEASQNMASASEEISATTEEISATVENVAQDSKKQTESILNISEVLVQLSSLVQLAENRAQSTNSNANDSRNVADLGREKVEHTVKAINSISSESNETTKVLQKVNSLSVQVGGIVNTINAIAEQTNLLALNAAIEAARAGENGKGFSVVAEEVRQLSEETNSKSKEITTIVSEMMRETENAVKAMERANIEVDKGVSVVKETDVAFINILNSIESMIQNIDEILDITSDEVASSDKVVSLINDVATIVETNSVNCNSVSEATQEEVNAINNLTATAEETSAMAEQLTKLVEKFKV